MKIRFTQQAKMSDLDFAQYVKYNSKKLKLSVLKHNAQSGKDIRPNITLETQSIGRNATQYIYTT